MGRRDSLDVSVNIYDALMLARGQLNQSSPDAAVPLYSARWEHLAERVARPQLLSWLDDKFEPI